MAKFQVTVEDKRYAVDAPDEATAWDWATAAHAERVQQHSQSVAAEQERGRREFIESERERPLTERIRSNIGAGLHTLGQGIAGIPRLFGADVGPTKEEVEESKQLKQQLGET